ncbi:hypothetical protein GOV11_04055 [Candidatus Woesearchaeota archaeon]|nr:hypothetical protein [Candidatus Woesearchaeota archaeon]
MKDLTIDNVAKEFYESDLSLDELLGDDGLSALVRLNVLKIASEKRIFNAEQYSCFLSKIRDYPDAYDNLSEKFKTSLQRGIDAMNCESKYHGVSFCPDPGEWYLGSKYGELVRLLE